MNQVFIITGTSRGIGEQLAKLLLERGDVVHGISRGKSSTLNKYDNYTPVHYDLSNVSNIDPMLRGLFDQIDLNRQEMICLINNAAMLEPLKSIDQCSPEELNKNLQISLMAPMIMTSTFIKLTDNRPIRRKIINISSGSGIYPVSAMSVYCTAKAGINMFTRCIGAEQSKAHNPVEVIAVNPGMVETEMQKIARGKNDEEFEMAKYFKQAHQAGQLQSAEELGKHLLNIVDKKFETGKLVNYFEG